MPRYFFHLSSDKVKVPDTNGSEFSCAERAYAHACKIALETQSYLDQEDGRWIIRIASAEDSLEMIVLFPVPVRTRKQAVSRRSEVKVINLR
jgi:hypothetical protein